MSPIESDQILLQLIERLDKKLDVLQEAQAALRVDVAALKATARFWGVLAGSLAGGVGAVVAAFINKS